MLSTRSSDLQHKTLLIKQDDKFFSRLLSRELSMTRTINKIGSYRGLPSSVPFVWESQPGTPKHHFHSGGGNTEPLPPLTPPPSFYSTAHSTNKVKRQSTFISNPIQTLFRNLNILKKMSTSRQPRSPTFSPYSTSSSSSSSRSSSVSSFCKRRSQLGSWGGSSSSSSSSSKLDEQDGIFIIGSPTSTLCFMISRRQI